MRFSIFATLAALGSGAVAQVISATVVVANVNTLTDKCKALAAPAQQLSIVNAPLLLIGQGPWVTVVTGFAEIVVKTTSFVTVLRADSDTKYAGSEATTIAEALRLFFAALRDLLNIVIGKAGFLTKIPFIGPPVASVLRSIEGVVEAFVVAIIDVLDDTVGAALKSDYETLETTLQTALTSYSPV